MVTIGLRVRPRTEFDKQLGRKLARAREKCNLSQRQAAKVVGVAASTLAQWEIGKHRPPLPHLVAICRAYGISAGALLDDLEVGR